MPSRRLLNAARSPASAGLVLATALTFAGGWWFATRLQAGAQRHAQNGESELAVRFATDWIEAVVPTALAGDEPKGRRARRVASARLDRLIARMQAGESPKEALALLARLRKPGLALTAEGAAWADWVAQRLVIEARHARTDRLRLIRDADATLMALAERPRRRLSPSAPAADADPAPIIDAQPIDPIEALVESLPPPPAAVEPLLARVAPTAPQIPASEPPPPAPAPAADESAWSPSWESQTPEPAPPAPLALAAASPRELLAALAEYDAPPAIAVGPTGLPDPEAEIDPETQRYLYLRDAMAAQGMERATIDHAKSFVSPDEDTRIDLVERLLVEPQSEAGPLLVLLAEDADAEVRAAAVSAMGASSSRAMVERAWRYALNDPDPRVGRLAEGLRERLR